MKRTSLTLSLLLILFAGCSWNEEDQIFLDCEGNIYVIDKVKKTFTLHGGPGDSLPLGEIDTHYYAETEAGIFPRYRYMVDRVSLKMLWEVAYAPRKGEEAKRVEKDFLCTKTERI